MPKAACLSHRSILNNGKSIGDRMLLTANDIVCCPPPLFHCFGCILGYMATATHGSAIVFPAEAFDPSATLKSVQEEKCTALYGVPTHFLQELELLRNGTIPYEGFQYLRTGIAAGSSIPAELMRKLHKTLNLTELTICYGMTETSPVSAMTTTDDPIEKRIDSVGRLMPHVEVKIIDPTNRTRIMPIGERGEVAVAGYLVMKEYWGAPEQTAEVMIPDDEGKIWMHVRSSSKLHAHRRLLTTNLRLATRVRWMLKAISRSRDVSRISSSKVARTSIRWKSRIAFSVIRPLRKSASLAYLMSDTEKRLLLSSFRILVLKSRSKR